MQSCNPILCAPIVNVLVLFYKILFSNLGLAIIGVTALLRFLLIPSFKSAMKIRDLAPEIDKLKKRHGGDKKKLMQAQADLYKEKGINPASGCLPQILQFIVLIGLFSALNAMLQVNTGELNKVLAPFLQFADSTSINRHFLYLDLAKPDTMGSFNISGKAIGIPGPLLIITTIVQLLSSKMMLPYVEAQEKKAAKTKEKTDDVMAATQQQMLYLFPVMTLIIGISFPSGLVLYWFVFSAFQIWYQVSTSGWGGATPWIRRLNLIKLPVDEKSKGKNN